MVPSSSPSSSSSSTSALAPQHNLARHHRLVPFDEGLPPPPVMERVLFQLHQRTCQFGLRYLSGSTRILLENFLLLVAIGGFGALFMLHRHFVLSVGGLGTSHRNAATLCFTSIPGMDVSADVHRVIILPHVARIGESLRSLHTSYVLDEAGQETCTIDDHRRISFSFSTTKAFLMLPSNHALLQDKIVRSQTLVVAPRDPNCFGEPFLQFLIHNLVGYETIVWNWSLGYIHQRSDAPSKGFVMSHKKSRIQELELPLASQEVPESENRVCCWSSFLFSANHNTFQASRRNILSKMIVVVKTTFLFLFSTTLISFTLRETQERMLEFTQELSRRVSIQLPLVDLIVFHLIHNLVFVPIMVGMMFFLIEFYSGDRLLAFLVMSIVWCVEVFSVISLRSYQGITFFPRMFFLLFSLFHIYFFANPFGFAYAAMGVVGLFMLHSMVFFWHRYELTAVASGRVTIDRPRQHYEHRSTAGTRFGMVSSSQGTSVARSGPTERSVERLLNPESPPLIRGPPSQEHVDFDPVAQPQQLSATTGRPVNDGSLYRRHVEDPNDTNAQSSISSQVSAFSRGRGNIRDDDDEHSSGFVSFMQGEVVLRRGQLQSRSRPDLAGGLLSMDSVHTLRSNTSGRDLQQHDQEDADLVYSAAPDRQPLIGNFFTQGASASDSSLRLNSTGGGHSVSGGIPSILDVRLTPRHRHGQESRENHPVSLPVFPSLPP